MRLVHEMLKRHRVRIIVGDFAAGWRDLMRVVEPGTGNRYEFGSLYPNSPRPLQFNFLRVGPHIDAESTLNALIDLTTNAGQMGERQYGFLHKTLRDLYLEHGVLTEDDWVLDDVREPATPSRARIASAGETSYNPINFQHPKGSCHG